jgi:tetratricopeptide (TPR) repeat protein
MAPEQAAADEAIDHRADLYAVGAMAYELLTGRPPFTAGTPQQVLAAQVMETPQPVTELRASVPPALETLIMRCLEKKPADRWQSAEEMLPHLEAAATPSGGITPTDMQPVTPPTAGASRRWLPWGAGLGAVTLLAAAYFLFFSGSNATPPPVDEQRVAVLPLENLTGDPSLDGLGLQASNWISDGLALTDLLAVVPFSNVVLSSRALSGAVESAALSSAWPEETGATIAVVGSYSAFGDSLEFRLRVVDAGGTVLTPVDPLMGTRDNIPQALGRLQSRVFSAVVGVVAPGHELASGSIGLTPPHPDAFQEYLEAMYKVGSDNRGAVENLERAVVIDPDFLNAYLLMSPALSNLRWREKQDSVCQIMATRTEDMVAFQRDWFELECSDDRVAEMNAAGRMARHSPGSLYRAALHGVYANRPRSVIGFCRRWDPDLSRMTRGWSRAMWDFCLRAFHMVEDYEGELAFIEEWKQWATSNPDWWRHREAFALFGLGRYEDGVELIEEQLSDLTATTYRVGLLDQAAQEADAHGHPDDAIEYWERALDSLSTLSQTDLDDAGARRDRAEILLYLGRPEEAVEILLGLVEENPDREDDLGRLGLARAKLGERSEAEKISERLVSMARPFERGDPTYWRACIAAELGDREEAVRLLGQAIEEGWQVGYRPHRSPYLKPLRGFDPFERLVEPSG